MLGSDDPLLSLVGVISPSLSEGGGGGGSGFESTRSTEARSMLASDALRLCEPEGSVVGTLGNHEEGGKSGFAFSLFRLPSFEK